MIVAEIFAKLGLLPDKEGFDKGNDLIKSIHAAVGAYLGVETIKQLGEMVEGTVEAAQSAQHLGEQMGVTTDAIQELGYAAEAADVPAEVLNGAMLRLARGMEQAEQGTGPAADALRKLHVSMKDLKGESLDQNLEVLADAFAKMPDGAEKAALATELFGRSAGPRMLQLLNQGKDGIVDLRNEAHKLGVVMSEEQIEKADQLDEAQKKLKFSIIGLKNEAVSAIIPELSKMAEALREWVGENREAIVSTLENVLHGIAEAFHIVGEVISTVTGFFIEHGEIATSVLEAVGVVIGIFAAQAAADWIIAFFPLAAGIATIAAIIEIVEHFGDIMKLAKEFWSEAWQDVLGWGREFASWFADLPGNVADWVEGIGESIKNAFQDAWDYVVRGAKDAWKEIEDTPVIGHIIRGGEWLADKLGSGGGSGFSQLASSPAFATGGTMVGDTHITNSFGDVHVQVDAQNVDEDEIGDMVGQKVREHQQDMVREAHNNMSGGKR